MTCTVIEFQASSTSSNFQEILGSVLHLAKFSFSPLSELLFVFLLDCARVYILNYGLQRSRVRLLSTDLLHSLQFSEK